MTRYEDAVDPEHIRQTMVEAQRFFDDADKRERNADQRAKLVADAHVRGWELVARAINDGFRMVAQAIEKTGSR